MHREYYRIEAPPKCIIARCEVFVVWKILCGVGSDHVRNEFPSCILRWKVAWICEQHRTEPNRSTIGGVRMRRISVLCWTSLRVCCLSFFVLFYGQCFIKFETQMIVFLFCFHANFVPYKKNGFCLRLDNITLRTTMYVLRFLQIFSQTLDYDDSPDPNVEWRLRVGNVSCISANGSGNIWAINQWGSTFSAESCGVDEHAGTLSFASDSSITVMPQILHCWPALMSAFFGCLPEICGFTSLIWYSAVECGISIGTNFGSSRKCVPQASYNAMDLLLSFSIFNLLDFPLSFLYDLIWFYGSFAS